LYCCFAANFRFCGLLGSSSAGFDGLRGLRILLRKPALGFFIVGGSILGGMPV